MNEWMERWMGGLVLDGWIYKLRSVARFFTSLVSFPSAYKPRVVSLVSDIHGVWMCVCVYVCVCVCVWL